ncbi:hypothetical protein I312_103138 [Cryptococcus bacillisporus CA1280]|uniref:RNA-binding domain-containing protein, X-linked 2 n=2 Tax=Cryptococcus gattii TaxID=552467 RepID=A0A0D0TLR8_CRYGA|nr:RNA-binding domain-containing protein, X-linked 2 [Cryptococcus bacillisporus CA1280]KIR62403.1 RNA-binding domain-containing protein, X-linked 2 [Cryptococcus bacillisporus CA1873]|eukprot:KIR62403.1 RNA-binding domain-containing protein, X-linked 2 [Cryptococcus gattii CA1873]
MNTIREINRINERELELGVKGSWHDEYKDSAYIYVGGLPFELTEGDLITIFSQWGEIMDVNLVRDKETGKSRGFGFLMYEDQRSTVLAVDNMNGTQVMGRTLKVDHTRNYRQQGKRNENGEYEEPEEPTYNAMPPILSDSGSSSSEDEENDLDEEDPMAEFIRAEKKKEVKKIKGNDGDGKKRKHEGETKKERRARKEAKRAKKIEKEEKKKRKEGRERSERAKSVKSERDERKRQSKDPEDSFWSRGKNASDRDDWRQGKWELEREEESREKGGERPRNQDGDVVKNVLGSHYNRSTGKGDTGSGRERGREGKPSYRREDDRRQDDDRRRDARDRDRAYSRRDDRDWDHDREGYTRRGDRGRDTRY